MLLLVNISMHFFGVCTQDLELLSQKVYIWSVSVHRQYQRIFQNDCTNLYSHQLCMRVLVAPYPWQHLVLLIFFILAILVAGQWYHIVVLICIYSISWNIECLFICEMAVWLSFIAYFLPFILLGFLISYCFSLYVKDVSLC